MHDQSIRLRQPDPDSLRAWARSIDAAFGEELSDAEFEHERELLELDRLIGAYDGETLEVLGLDAAAERSIWEWLFGMDLLGHVRGWRGPVPHPLMLQLTEPRRLGLVVREGPVAAADRRAGGAGGPVVRRGRVGDLRADRRVLPVERRTVAAGGVG